MAEIKDFKGFSSGKYWRDRSDMLYYRYIDYILRSVGRDARSMLDVGTGNCPYLEWFDWIETRVSVDVGIPYSSPRVQGIQGDIHALSFEQPFDIVTALQVMEHVPDAGRFGRRLLELGKTVIVSVPFKWPAEPPTPGHVHDPVGFEKMRGWMEREPNYQIVVQEPFTTGKGRRLIAIYDQDHERKFKKAEFKNRRPG